MTRSSSITIDDYRLSSNKGRMNKLLKKYNNITELLEDSTVVHAIQRIPYLSREKIDVKILATFLKKQWPEFGEKEHIYSSYYRKCISLLDYLKYANFTELK